MQPDERIGFYTDDESSYQLSWVVPGVARGTNSCVGLSLIKFLDGIIAKSTAPQ